MSRSDIEAYKIGAECFIKEDDLVQAIAEGQSDHLFSEINDMYHAANEQPPPEQAPPAEDDVAVEIPIPEEDFMPPPGPEDSASNVGKSRPSRLGSPRRQEEPRREEAKREEPRREEAGGRDRTKRGGEARGGEARGGEAKRGEAGRGEERRDERGDQGDRPAKNELLLNLHRKYPKEARVFKWDATWSLDELTHEWETREEDEDDRSKVDIMKMVLKFLFGLIEKGLGGLLYLDGWAKSVGSDMSKFDKCLSGIQQMLLKKTKMNPFLELGLIVLVSMFAWHFDGPTSKSAQFDKMHDIAPPEEDDEERGESSFGSLVNLAGAFL